MSAPSQYPAPDAIPIAATSQSEAAVVRPRTDRPCRMIAPAPRKPMPLTICAAMRVGSIRVPVAVKKFSKPYADTSVNSADPTQTTRCVRRPASRSRSSRSKPIAPPRPAAMTRRRRTCGQERVGPTALRTWSIDGLLLESCELLDAPLGEPEQLVEPLPGEGILLGRRLQSDEAAVAGHDDVHVRVCGRVLRVVEVEHRDAADDTDGERGDRVSERAREAEVVERAPACHVRAADRRAPRAAV